MRVQAERTGPRHLRHSASGFSLIELLIVVAIILIIAAIAIPNFMRAKMAANEAAAVAACKKITTAQVVYASTYGLGYSQRLDQLGPPGGGGSPNLNAAALLDEILTAGAKHGYTFTYAPIDSDGNGIPEAFTINADPIIPGSSGDRYFFTDQSGVIRHKKTGPATATDPPIG
jgi:prepilin-type N-terminal cleavage/methylation domain-containing protein